MMDAAEKAEFESLLSLAEDNAKTDWEMEFVESLRDQATNPFFSPSDRQWEKLDQIANEEPRLPW